MRLLGLIALVFLVGLGCSGKSAGGATWVGTFHAEDPAKAVQRFAGTLVENDGLFQLDLKADGTFAFGDPRVHGNWKETSNGVEISLVDYSSRWNFLFGRRVSDQAATKTPVEMAARGTSLVVKFRDLEVEYAR